MPASPHPYPLYAFHVLESKLSKVAPHLSITSFPYQSGAPCVSSLVNITAPLFITWNVISRTSDDHKELRGCIGTFSPLPLEQGIKEYSLITALEDTRFSPITKRELSRLSVSVTVLMNFQDCEAWDDWELGKHGIRVKLNLGGRAFGATFLPEVAVEQGWDKLETIDHCIRKSGYKGGYELSGVKVVRYEGVKRECTYQEYREVIESMK